MSELVGMRCLQKILVSTTIPSLSISCRSFSANHLASYFSSCCLPLTGMVFSLWACRAGQCGPCGRGLSKRQDSLVGMTEDHHLTSFPGGIQLPLVQRRCLCGSHISGLLYSTAQHFIGIICYIHKRWSSFVSTDAEQIHIS